MGCQARWTRDLVRVTSLLFWSRGRVFAHSCDMGQGTKEKVIQQCSVDIHQAWATGAPPLSYGPISSDCCLHFSLFLFYSVTSNIHMSVDVFLEWTHVCLQRPGLHRSITASWKKIDFYGNSYLHCCLKFTIIIKTILIMHCRWLLTCYYKTNNKLKAFAWCPCLLHCINLIQQKTTGNL